MTKCQSSQNRFVQAALTAATLAFALTVLPGTALADALPEDQQPAVTEGRVTPAVEEKGNQITYEDGNQTIDEEDEQTYPSEDGQDQAATTDQVSDGAGNVETAAGGSEEDQQDEPVATDTADSLTTDESNPLDNTAVVETEDESQTEQEDAVAGEPAAQAEDGPRALLASPALASPSPESEADPAPRTGHWVVDARSGSLERYWVWDDDGSTAKGVLVGPENGAGWYAWAMTDGRILRNGKWDSGAGRVYVADNDGRLMGSDMTSDGWVVTSAYDGSMQRYWVDATAKAARSGFFTVPGYGDVFGRGGQGYVFRGDFQFGGRKWSADNDGRLRSGWYSTSGFGDGAQLYWMGDTVYGSPHAAAASRLVGPSEGDDSGHYAWAMADGRILRNGKWDSGAGRVYVADNDGRLMGSDMTSDGWVVTRDYDGSWQRYYVDAKAKAARSGFFTVPGYGDVFGMGGQGYVFRGDFQFGGRKWSADNDGRLRSGWYSTSGFGQGTQLYWMGDTAYGSPHAAAAGRLVGPSEGDASGYYAWAMADGRILRSGKWDGGAGRVYVADADGRLMGSDMTSDGWVVTSAYDGSMQRYWVDAKSKAAYSGFFTVPGYGDLFGLGGQGYVLRGVRPWGSSVILADNDGRLPSKEGWDVTDRYGQGTQRYWIEPIYSTYLGAKQGYSEAGYAHYTLPTGYVLRNDAIPVSSTKGYRANNDGLAEEVTFGWYQMSNGHWFYLSLYSYANFETDKYVSGGKIIDLGHYDVLHDLWLKVNGYKSGSRSPYASRTKYLVVSGWDDCYLAVFVGVGNNPNEAGYWQPLFGWNCGNGSKSVINQDAQKQAEEKGRETNWEWDPEWSYYMAEGNTASNKASLDPVKFRYFIQMNTTDNYQMPVVPTNTGERWFTSVKLTLGYHSTITGNPNNELYRHVSHGCIRLDVNNAHILYGLMAPKGTKTVVNGVTYEGVGPGTRCIQLKRGSY